MGVFERIRRNIMDPSFNIYSSSVLNILEASNERFP